MTLRIETLSLENFKDYESLTSCQSDGGCYCSFWHQKWASVADWQKCQRETPEINRSIVFEKLKSGFHIGVLVYKENELAAWVSVAPVIDFYWTWRRTIELKDDSKLTAGIVCFTIAPKFRGQGLQVQILEELKVYGKKLGWIAIEGYPFDESAREKHKDNVVWSGLTKGFVDAGFERADKHWLSNADAERSIYTFRL